MQQKNLCKNLFIREKLWADKDKIYYVLMMLQLYKLSPLISQINIGSKYNRKIQSKIFKYFLLSKNKHTNNLILD